jgi:para-nitrobenzyl esterase
MPGQPPPQPPAAPPAAPGAAPQVQAPRGAGHSAEIQYAMGNLDLDKRYTWEPADYAVSKTMQAFFVNFIKTGNPNGAGLPTWPAYSAETGHQRMLIDVNSQAGPEPHRARYLALDGVIGK